MNLESIPKSFWHALSLALLILTTAFAVVTYRSGNYTLKYEGLELTASHAQAVIAGAQDDLRSAVQQHQQRAEQWEQEKKALQLALADAQHQIDKLSSARVAAADPAFSKDLNSLKEQLTAAAKTAEAAPIRFTETPVRVSMAPAPTVESNTRPLEHKALTTPVQSKLDELDRIREKLRAKE